MVLLIDNYDSFSYNLFQLIGEIEPDIRVIRNDEMTVEEIRELKPDHIILSPGPGRPENAGVMIDVIRTLGKEIPILGVCLGHQAICAAFGATVTYARELMHGKQSIARFDRTCLLFRDCPETAKADPSGIRSDAGNCSEPSGPQKAMQTALLRAFSETTALMLSD